MIPGDFFHKGAVVHSMCRVEKRQGAHLLLRVTAEMGTVSLLGLSQGTQGHLEIEKHILPFRVARVALPLVEVVTFPDRVRPIQRQLLRVPASFLVRLRRQGSTGLWISGQGVDISAGGFCFTLTPPYVPKQAEVYDIEMLLTLPRDGEERPLLGAPVRWVRGTSSNIYVGIEATHPSQQKMLTNAAAQFQQALFRSPEDYLLL